MTDFLKGNYQLPKKGRKRPARKAKTLTEELEQEALSKLGGSLCFVMKDKTFLWHGDEDTGGGGE